MTSNKPPIFLKFRSSRGFILTTVALSLFTDLWLYGIVVPTLPFILRERLGVERGEVQGYTSLLLGVYAGASVLFSLPAGILADRLPSRKTPFTAGLLALILSTLLLALGNQIWVLILARTLQGMSAAVVWTIGMALVKDTVGVKNMGTAVGSMFSVISVGELLAPVLGGVVYEKAGNNAVFGMGFAFLGVDVGMRLGMVERKVARRWGVLEDGESSDEEANDGGQENRGESRNESIESSPLLNKTTANNIDPTYILPETLPRWAPNPLLYVLLTSPRIQVAQLVSLTQATVLSLFDATIPLVAQNLFNFTPLSAGLIFIPLVLPYLLLGPLSGHLVDKYGVKIFGTLGPIVLAIPLVCLRIPHAGGTPEIIKFAVILAFCSFGLCMLSPLSVVEASAVMEEYDRCNKGRFGREGPYAQLYAVNSMVFSAGLAVGPGVAGVLRERVGWGDMCAVVAAFCVLVGGLCFWFLGGRLQVLGGSRQGVGRE